MLSASDLLRLPYTPDLTRAGIAYARSSLRYTYNRMGLEPAARLRKIVAGVAVELAFQRWLDAGRVPYDRLGATAFTEPDRYDLRLGGRRCDVKSFLLGERRKISHLRRNPAWLLSAEALVPLDQFESSSLSENDVYIFGYLAGLETRSRADLDRALRAGQEVHLLYTPSQPRWLGRREWRSLGRLALKSDVRRPVEVEIGGQDRGRAALTERLRLEPRTRVETQAEFYSWLYLHVAGPVDGAIGVRSLALRETRLVDPGDWSNIWVYGMEIFIAGWLAKADFRSIARRLPRGASTRLYPRTHTDNLSVPVQQLRPISDLVQRVQRSAWARRP